MDNYRLEMLDINESRFTGVDNKCFKQEKKHLIYSGHSDHKPSEGVDLIITDSAEKSLNWESINQSYSAVC